MLFEKLFRRPGRPEPVSTPVLSNEDTAREGGDGWVELVDGHLVAHDPPAATGRFATIQPVGSVRLWVNGDLATDLAVLTSTDQVRWELDEDPCGFFSLAIAPEGMSATLTVTADPLRVPDTIAIAGQNPVQVSPWHSHKARHRKESPKQLIMDQLERLGICFGVDDEAIDRELVKPCGLAVNIARGQEARPFAPGQWTWRLGEWGLVEAGQIIASHEGGHPAVPHITVMGEEVHLYSEEADTEGFTPGTGTRLVAGGRVVAAASGRVHRVPHRTGCRLDIHPVKSIQGNVTADMDVQTDVLVYGAVVGATVTSSGDILVSGDVEKSELRAHGIAVGGSVTQSRLFTEPGPGFAALRSELTVLQQMMERLMVEVREIRDPERLPKEGPFREVAQFTRSVRRKADELKVADPIFTKVLEEVAQHFALLDGVAAFKVSIGEALTERLAELVQRGADIAMDGDVLAGSLAHVEIRASRNIEVHDKIVGSTLICGGGVHTPPEAQVSNSYIAAGDEVKLGVLARARGSSPVTVRARRADVEEIQMGCAFEFGAERKEFKVDALRVSIGVSRRGHIVVKQV